MSQHKALDRIALTNPDAKVIGWDGDERGPVVRYPNGATLVVVGQRRRTQKVAA